MNEETIVFTLISCSGLFFFGFLSYALLFKPQLGQRIIKSSQVPGALWTKKEGADGIVILLILVMFVFFSCLSCLMLYGWIQIGVSILSKS